MAFTQTDFENVLRALGLLQSGMSPPYPWPTMPCPDAAMLRTTWEVVGWLPIERRAGQRAVIVVLESPHGDEFELLSCGHWWAVGPLQNKEQLKLHFQTNVGAHIAECRPDDLVILLNAVRYQCSLGKPLRGNRANTQQRDRIFKECWRQGARCDFIERLVAVYKAGDVIVNACTGTMFDVLNRKTKLLTDDLKWLVEDAIIAALPGHRELTEYRCRKRKKARRPCISDIGTYHPSVWWGKDKECLWPTDEEEGEQAC